MEIISADAHRGMRYRKELSVMVAIPLVRSVDDRGIFRSNFHDFMNSLARPKLVLPTYLRWKNFIKHGYKSKSCNSSAYTRCLYTSMLIAYVKLYGEMRSCLATSIGNMLI